MSISFPIPPNTRHLPAGCIQKYIYNPARGEYELNPNDRVQKVFEIQKNCLYLIERVSFCSTLPEDHFLRLLDNNNLPRIDLFKEKNSFRIFNDKMLLTNYRRESDISSFCNGDDDDDFLMAKFYGKLRSSADTVGYDRIDLILSFTVFCLDQNTIVDSVRGKGKF